MPRGYDRSQQYPVLYVLDGSSQDQPLASTLDGLWRENNLLVERVAASLSGTATRKSFLYLSASENETDDIRNGHDAMAVVLEDRAPAGLVWYVERTRGADHSSNAQRSGSSALTKWGAFAGR